MKVSHIKTGDTARIISGHLKGKTAKVVKVLPREGVALLEGVGVMKRKIKPSQVNPRGGVKDIHQPIPVSKLKREEAKK